MTAHKHLTSGLHADISLHNNDCLLPGLLSKARELAQELFITQTYIKVDDQHRCPLMSLFQRLFLQSPGDSPSHNLGVMGNWFPYLGQGETDDKGRPLHISGGSLGHLQDKLGAVFLAAPQILSTYRKLFHWVQSHSSSAWS